MVWASPNFLKACEDLSGKGVRPLFEAGEVVARGFADLGYEEFLILPSGKMLSLMTGKVTAIGEGDREKLFLIPSPERLAAELEMRGRVIDAIYFPNASRWECRVRIADELRVVRADSVREVLIQSLLSDG